MQTLLRKLVTHNSANLSHNSLRLVYTHAPKAFTVFPKSSQTQVKDHILNSFPSHPLHHFHSWHSKHTLPGKIRGLLSDAVVREHFMLNSFNSLLRIGSRRLVDYRPKLFRAQFYGQRFDINRGFDSYNRRWNSWFHRLTTNDVVLGLIIANVAVFLTWRVAGEKFMINNFMISLDNIKHGRLHTLITNAFSHIDVGHIISNMIGLYFFGMNIGRVFGPEFLLKLYLAGAIGGSVFYLVHQAFLAQTSSKGLWVIDHSKTPALGASGAVNAIMLLDIFLFPKATLYFDFIIPVPAILLGIFLIGKDILRILEGDSHISGSAHLGGAVVAAIAWARVRRGKF